MKQLSVRQGSESTSKTYLQDVRKMSGIHIYYTRSSEGQNPGFLIISASRCKATMTVGQHTYRDIPVAIAPSTEG